MLSIGICLDAILSNLVKIIGQFIFEGSKKVMFRDLGKRGGQKKLFLVFSSVNLYFHYFCNFRKIRYQIQMDRLYDSSPKIIGTNILWLISTIRPKIDCRCVEWPSAYRQTFSPLVYFCTNLKKKTLKRLIKYFLSFKFAL